MFRRQPRSYGYPYSLLNDLKGEWRNYKEFTTVYDSLIHRCPLPTGWESRLPPIQPIDDQKAAPPGSAEHHRPRRPARSGRRWRGVRGEQRTQRDVLQRPALLRGTKRAKMVKNAGLSQKKMMILIVSWWLNEKDLGCGDIMIWCVYIYIYVLYIDIYWWYETNINQAFYGIQFPPLWIVKHPQSDPGWLEG